MSFETWCKEFYPVPAEKMANATDLECVDHSLRKWNGLKWENLEAHGLLADGNVDGDVIISGDEDRTLYIDTDSCALCVKHYRDGDCGECPLYLSRGLVKCDQVDSANDEMFGPLPASPYGHFSYVVPFDESVRLNADPMPMIRALEKAREYVLAHIQETETANG